MNERISILINLLKKEGLVYNQSDFSKKAGIGHNIITDIKGGRKPLSVEYAHRIINAFPFINMEWLINGSGSIKKNEVVKVEYDKFVKVPLVSKYAYAGYLLGYGDDEYIGTLPTIEYAPELEMTGNYLAFEVKGDSMDDGSIDSYKEGEILICREIEPYLCTECKLPISHRDFVIAHKDGILIKQIINHDVKNHTITIHSLNPMYEDKVLDLCDVYKMFLVVESRRQRKR